MKPSYKQSLFYAASMDCLIYISGWVGVVCGHMLKRYTIVCVECETIECPKAHCVVNVYCGWCVAVNGFAIV